MSRLRRLAPRPAFACVALALAACSYQPSRVHPKLPALVPIETTMACPQVDLAIDRADTVRWLIRDDGGKLETSNQRAARYAGNLIIVPVSILGGVPSLLPDGGNAVLNAADGRLRELLQLKRERGCAPRPTIFPGVDDLALLAELEDVQARLDAGGGDEAALLQERTRLLDGLRVVAPGPAESPEDDARPAYRTPDATD